METQRHSRGRVTFTVQPNREALRRTASLTTRASDGDLELRALLEAMQAALRDVERAKGSPDDSVLDVGHPSPKRVADDGTLRVDFFVTRPPEAHELRVLFESLQARNFTALQDTLNVEMFPAPPFWSEPKPPA